MAWRACVAMIAAMMLGGCATRGSQNIECEGFTTARNGGPFRRALPLSLLERQIRGEDVGAAFASDPLVAKVRDSIAAAKAGELRAYTGALAPTDRGKGALLLSGGGQWGAFGAGYMGTLAGRARFPNISVVTGVSTGGLQALFVGAATPDRWERLEQAYSVDREKQVVSRNPKLLVVLTGSFAGLSPLRRRIDEALCPRAQARAADPCPMITALKASHITMLVGFIEARTGDFFYADIGEIANKAPREVARQCIAGVALASAAMPVFFQQVRINDQTYYDGGVRQSVFANFTEQVLKEAGRGDPAGPPPLYVVRNGPTSLALDPDSDRKADALTAAMRAESIVVNQLEVGSVAALRLQRPTGDINFTSADGWDRHPVPAGYSGKAKTCGDIRAGVDSKKDKDAMFSPAFMQCLMDYGQTRANADRVWRKLMEIGDDRRALEVQLPVPANDN